MEIWKMEIPFSTFHPKNLPPTIMNASTASTSTFLNISFIE
jgi:hypothetical protein